MSATIYSYEEIAKHNNRADLWMAIDGKVYDITKFQDEVSTEKLSVSASDLVFDKIF
jgi:cytochrome b involved in lipid metabolism